MRRVLISLIAALCLAGSVPAVTARQANPALDRSPEKQAARLKLIKQLQATGYIGDINDKGRSSGIVDVFVKPSFLAGDFKDKVNVVSMIYGYYFDGSKITDTVFLLDSRSGKSVGTYNIQRSLRME